MIKKIKLHIQKYIFYDIFAILIFIAINILVYKFVKDYQENKNSELDYSYFDNTIKEAYKINPSLFKFDENNIAIVKMDDLIRPITNGKDTMYLGIVPLTKEQDQCVGYFIVKKIKNDLQIDSSHMCDMIDY